MENEINQHYQEMSVHGNRKYAICGLIKSRQFECNNCLPLSSRIVFDFHKYSIIRVHAQLTSFLFIMPLFMQFVLYK